VAISQLMLVPIFYGVGSIFNSYIANKIDSSRTFEFKGSAICIGLGLLNYFNPKNTIQELIEYFIRKSCCL
jgi:hypothetical protein